MQHFIATFLLTTLSLSVLGDKCVELGQSCDHTNNNCCGGHDCNFLSNEAGKGMKTICIALDSMIGDECNKEPDRLHRCKSGKMDCKDNKCIWSEKFKCKGKGDSHVYECCQGYNWKEPNVHSIRSGGEKPKACPCSEEYRGCLEDSDCCDGGKKLKCAPQKPLGKESIEKYCMVE